MICSLVLCPLGGNNCEINAMSVLTGLSWLQDRIRLFARRKLLADRARLGRWGEKRCERFLRNKGLHTLTRNYSCATGEIDLIMVDIDHSLVFVEVRTRAGEDFAPAESSVNRPKREKLIKTARYFLATHKIYDRPCRFDVVIIILGPTGRPQIRHYRNAFKP